MTPDDLTEPAAKGRHPRNGTAQRPQSPALSEDSSLLAYRRRGDVVRVTARGLWTCDEARTLEESLSRLAAGSAGRSRIEMDMSQVAAFDTYGAWLLERFRREVTATGGRVHLTDLRPGHRSLLDEVAGLNRDGRPDASHRDRKRLPDAAVLLSGIGREFGSFLLMLGAVVASAVRLGLRPRAFRLTSTIHQFDRVAWQAVPIILMITLLIGAIIAQQGFFQFRRFGAELYVVNMVGFLIMREIGVLLVAIMVAGRTGSSYTAELGSMKMREEIDALKTMGFDPVAILILPRVLVLIVAMPALAFLGSMAALVGAGLVAVFYAGMNPELYLQQLREAVTIEHFQVGLIKAPFIGAVIGIIACNEGLQVRGSAASLGEHTTRSVVKSIFMIIVLDGLFALFFSAIGM